MIKVAVAGSAVGFITGFFGVGGGFIIVPVLSLILAYGIQEAIGTSLLIIVINSGVALASRVGDWGAPWDVTVPFTLAGLVVVIIGAHLGAKLRSNVLARTFAGLILALAVYTIARSVASL